MARGLDLPRVRTNSDEPRHRGISVLVAPLTTPGIEVRRFPVLGGGYLCEVFLDGVEIPRRISSARSTGLGRPHAHARLRAHHRGEARRPHAWIVDMLEDRLAETGRLEWRGIA
jgi:hypothetical protein